MRLNEVFILNLGLTVVLATILSLVGCNVRSPSPVPPLPPVFDLLEIKYFPSKGRLQDDAYRGPQPVVEEILASGAAAIPTLIELIKSERLYAQSPVSFWPLLHEGDMALLILADLFLDPTWQKSYLPSMCWDSFLERNGQTVSASILLQEFIKEHGREHLSQQWEAVWLEYNEAIRWSVEGRFFVVDALELRNCQ